MRKTLILLMTLGSLFIFQQGLSQASRLKVFIDCSNTWCDMNYLRTEITLVDFLLDRQAADVHILITEQRTGGGGSQFQIIFYGQNRFKAAADTNRYNMPPIATDFERRAMLVKYLQLGLVPYLVRSGNASAIQIELKRPAGDTSGQKAGTSSTQKDPWNYWVLTVGLNGELNTDANYKNSRISTNFSANRVTDKIKTSIAFYGAKNQSVYKLQDDNGNEEKIVINNSEYSLEHYLIKSLGQHWSYGYSVEVSRNSFSNNKNRLIGYTGIEYAIFPYKQVNSRYFTISYLLDVRRNKYFDTTLYDKTRETLAGHTVKSRLTFNQKWGTIGFGAEYHNFFHNWRFLRLGVNADMNIRITGGLSFNLYTYGELTRDQIFLPKGGATQQEVLTRRRQLASNYNFATYFGLSYRFGSKLNNFVNPRFD